MNGNRLLKLTMLLVLVTICLSPLYAQFRSSVEGVVTDSTGAVIPEAKVVLTNVDTGVSQSVQTNGAGLFRFPSLGPGRYKLSGAKQGFATMVQENIVLLAEEIRTVRLALKVGVTTETVTVTAEANSIQLSESKVASDISAQEISQLPLPGRNVGNLLNVLPGVTGTGSAGGNNFDNDIFGLVNNPQVNGGGQRGEGNSFYMDNTLANSNPDPGVFNITPNPDSIQELQVSVNDYSAEYGRSSGLVIQTVSKSGTNNFHGSLFEYHQDNRLSARNALSGGAPVPVFRRNEFGGSLGGPILKNKLFGFFSWDEKKSSSPVVFQDTVEAPEFVAYLKSNLPNNLSTKLLTSFPGTNNGFLPGTVVRVQDLAPNCAGAPPLPGVSCAMPLFGTTTESFSGYDNGRQFNTRVDLDFTKDRFYANYYRKVHNTQGINTRPAFASPDSFAGISNYANLDWTHTFSPKIINDAAMGLTRISGLGTCSHCEVPAIGGMDIAGFGAGFAPAEFIQNDFEWRDILSWNHDKHALKFGFDIFRDQENDLFSGPTQRPGYGFGVNNLPGAPDQGLDPIFDFALDLPLTQGAINYDLRTGALSQQSVGYRTANFNFFGQDDFKIKPNLSVNYGLRWDFDTSPNEVAGRTSSIILGSGSTLMQQIAGASVGIVKSVTPNHPIAYFAPRFGFAWDPTKKGKLSIRGGMGVFFERAPNIYWSDAVRANPPLIGSITADASNPSAPQPVYGICALDHAPFNCPLPPASQLPTGLNPRGGALACCSSIGGVDPATKQAYTISRFFGVQYALMKNWVVEANYLGSQSVHEYVRTERNRCVGCFNPVTGSATGFRPNNFFRGISYGDNSGWAHYNGGTLSVLHRLSQSFTFQGAFTFGRTTSIVDAPGLGRDSLLSPVYNPYDLNAQRGPASFDIPRAFSAHGVWDLPRLSSQNRLVRGILGGWQWSGTTTLQSGYPFTIVDCNHSPTGNGGTCLIPNVAPGVKDRTCSRTTWENGGCFSASEFTIPCPLVGAAFLLNCGSGTWEGNAGRNSFRGPGFANVDFSSSKYFHIPWFVGTEGAKLKVLGEFFNLFNRTNLNSPGSNLAFAPNIAITDPNFKSRNPNFGRPAGAFNPRQIEVGGRIDF